MTRSLWIVSLSVGLMTAGAGCAHRIEFAALNAWSAALASQDVDQLRKATSEDFEKQALRLDEAVDDLKILRVPTGKTEIVSVEEVSETEKIVSAKVGDGEKKVRYRLVREPGGKKWVVDDVFLKQKREGVESTKSVTEQMNLVLSVREFLRAWDSADREAALAVTTPKFRAALDALPPAYFAQLANRVIGPQKERSRPNPEAQMDDNIAIVKINRSIGQLVLTYELKDERWFVSDAAVESRDDKEHIPSVQKYAIALTTAVDFLRAFGDQDRETLARVCAPKFYKGGLAPADLSLVTLPRGESPEPQQQFRMIAKRAELVVPTESDMVKVSLVREEAADADSPVRYLVEDVALYAHDGGNEKRLSSMFTAHAMLAVFCDALSRRDLPMIRKTSSADFNRRVWDRLKQSGPAGTVPIAAAASHTTIDDLPLGEIPPEAPETKSTKYNGAVTEIAVQQGDQRLTYLVREHAGEVRVDDILLPEDDKSRSLKETAELIVPLREFVAGLQLRDLGLIQRSSSSDYNRLVWKQTDRVPDLTATALRHLRAPVDSIDAKPDRVLLTLGDERWGAQVMLTKEQSQLVVDDVVLVAGLEAKHRMRLKSGMRQELAMGGSTPSRDDEVDPLDERTTERPDGVVQAKYEEYADGDDPLEGDMADGHGQDVRKSRFGVTRTDGILISPAKKTADNAHGAARHGHRGHSGPLMHRAARMMDETPLGPRPRDGKSRGVVNEQGDASDRSTSGDGHAVRPGVKADATPRRSVSYEPVRKESLRPGPLPPPLGLDDESLSPPEPSDDAFKTPAP